MRSFPASPEIPGLAALFGHPDAATFEPREEHQGEAALPDELQTLILVVGKRDATLCCNCNGVTRLLRTFSRGCQAGAESDEACERIIGEDRASRRKFARELMALLQRNADSRHYDGVIILADESIREDFCRACTKRLPNLLIAPLLKPDSPCFSIQ